MSAIFKGRQSASLVSEEPVFDAATGIREYDQTFAGSKDVIFGLARGFEEDGISYRVTNSGPVYAITARVPQNDPVTENPDRYEIFTESQSLSLFQLPVIADDAAVYDNAVVGAQDDPYRAVAERFAEETIHAGETHFTNPSPELDRFEKVVKHLRAGVTGYEDDNLILSRFRQIDNSYAVGAGKFTLRESAFVYTTTQLGLPANVAFQLSGLPTGEIGVANLPTGRIALARWGWRLRGQRVERIGSLTEQTVQLMYAAWSYLAYPAATGNLAW